MSCSTFRPFVLLSLSFFSTFHSSVRELEACLFRLFYSLYQTPEALLKKPSRFLLLGWARRAAW